MKLFIESISTMLFQSMQLMPMCSTATSNWPHSSICACIEGAPAVFIMVKIQLSKKVVRIKCSFCCHHPCPIGRWKAFLSVLRHFKIDKIDVVTLRHMLQLCCQFLHPGHMLCISIYIWPAGSSRPESLQPDHAMLARAATSQHMQRSKYMARPQGLRETGQCRPHCSIMPLHAGEHAGCCTRFRIVKPGSISNLCMPT